MTSSGGSKPRNAPKIAPAIFWQVMLRAPTAAGKRYQLQHAPGAESVGGDLRLQIERALLRLAGVLGDQPQQAAVELAGMPDPGRRDADAFFEDAQRIGGNRARHPAADIGMVT